MSDELSDLSEAFGSLLDEVRAVEQRLLNADPPLEEADVLDGYRWALSLLRVASEAYIWGDADKPILVDVIGPYLKWGGDNSDAFYQLAPVDPSRSYRVTGNRGDAGIRERRGQACEGARRARRRKAGWRRPA